MGNPAIRLHKDSTHERDDLRQCVPLLISALDAVDDGILIVDHQGQIVRYNRSFAQMWRLPEGIHEGKDEVNALEMLIDQLSSPEEFRKNLKLATRSPETESFDILHFKDGRIFERHSRPQRLDSEIVGRVWSFRDVTRRTKAEEQLKKTNEELETRVAERTAELQRSHLFINSVVENIPDMVFVKDAKDLRFVRFNKAGENLLGYSKDELIGKNDYDLFPRSEADFFTQKDRDVLKRGELTVILDEPIHTRHQGTRILHTKKIPIYSDDGTPEYLLGISEDITEKKQAEEDRIRLREETLARQEAEKGIRLRDDFISIATHELRTPLASLKSQVALLRHLFFKDKLSSFPKEKIDRTLELAALESDRIARLIDDLLDVSRITAERLSLHLEKTDLLHLTSNVLDSLNTQAQASGSVIEILAAEQVQGVWDPVRISQVVTNLISNAIKFGAGKPIEVRLWKENNRAKISVRDHGIGIAKEDQSRIFDRFERAVSGRYYGGLGLGLYISKFVLEAHGGSISVESEVDQGATFTLEIPCD